MFSVVRRESPGLAAIPFVGPQPTAPIVTPVVLVHGYLGTATGWGPLVRRLHADGFVNIFTSSYDALSADVPQLAIELAGHVARTMRGVRWPGVHLIGYSLGGLLARYAVQRLELDRITRTVATIATPHRGSPLAWLGPGPAAAQLRPGSALLRELPPLEATPRVKWAVIHAGADLVVPPPPPQEARCLPGYGHHSILSAPELADAVVAHLRDGELIPAERFSPSVRWVPEAPASAHKPVAPPAYPAGLATRSEPVDGALQQRHEHRSRELHRAAPGALRSHQHVPPPPCQTSW